MSCTNINSDELCTSQNVSIGTTSNSTIDFNEGDSRLIGKNKGDTVRLLPEEYICIGKYTSESENTERCRKFENSLNLRNLSLDNEKFYQINSNNEISFELDHANLLPYSLNKQEGIRGSALLVCMSNGINQNIILSGSKYLISPTPSPDNQDRYNQAFIQGQNLVNHYGKEAIFPVVDTEIGRIGCVASEEILYPEISKCLSKKGI